MPHGLPNQPGSDDFKLRVYKDDKGWYLPANLLVTQAAEDGAPVVVGPANPLPARPAAEYLFTQSEASLADGEEIDSGWLDMAEIGKYQLEGLGDVAGLTMTQESSTEPAGAGVFRTTSFQITGSFVLANFPARQRYMRMRWINNTGGPVTNVALCVKAQYGSADQHSVFPLVVEPRPFSQAALVQAVIKGQQPDGDYVDAPMDGLVFQEETPLAADAFFESPWRDSDKWKSIELVIATDVASALAGIEIEFTDDAQATTPRAIASEEFSFSEIDVGHGHTTLRLAPILDGFRIRYTNGPDPQTTFFMAATLRNAPTQALEQLIEDPIEVFSVIPVTRTVLSGRAPGNGYQNVGINDGGALLVTDFESEVGRGNVPNFESLNKFGRSGVLSNGDTEDIWFGGGDYTGQPLVAPETVDILSSSNADSAAGTGMQSVRISGLKTSTSTVIESEVVATGGIAGTTSPSAWWRVIDVEGVAYGTGGTNAGTITVQHTVTVANIFAVVPIGSGKGQVAAFTVPAGVTGHITSLYGLLSRANGGAGSSGFALLTRPPGQGGYNVIRHYEISSTAPANPPLRSPIEIVAGTDVKLRAIDVSDAGTTLTGEMDVMFVTIPA